ncbi:MAG: hypothetical protein D6732_21585 [Methanobacteriota archaeon]|nr:MAG: hypothetical protein D6732_21585 [Euryarchaeota archaeon]
MVDFDKVLKEERKYLAKNEPTFYQDDPNGRIFVGKVGRLATGEDIRIRIEFPEFYPIVKPVVKVSPSMSHPNVDNDGNLDLQLLAEWEPSYRVKDIISAARRLFIHSRNLAQRKTPTQTPVQVQASPTITDTELERLAAQVESLQKELALLEAQGRQQLEASFKKQGFDLQKLPNVSPEKELKAELMALEDLLELLDFKFEEAEIDQTDFFRLFKHYSAEWFKTAEKLAELKGGIETHVISNKTKAKEPIRS